MKWLLIGIGAYVALVALVILFFKGATMKPTPHPPTRPPDLRVLKDGDDAA